jgi:hypothetical protein
MYVPTYLLTLLPHQIDRLLSHHEEFAHILDAPPDLLVTRDAWLGAPLPTYY